MGNCATLLIKDNNDYLPMYTRWDGYVANRMFDAYRVESYLKKKSKISPYFKKIRCKKK